MPAVAGAVERGNQVVTAATRGRRVDLATWMWASAQGTLGRLRRAVCAAGVELADSYISLTEISKYPQGVPEEMLNNRLYPVLPPEGKPIFCFYPMSKRRDPDANWFTEDYESRKDMMYEHGSSGRKFAGRVLQVITGSTGLDDYEWGVTLFCQNPDDVKEVVYTMRFDRASALYGIFGRFYVGMIAGLDECLDAIGAPAV